MFRLFYRRKPEEKQAHCLYDQVVTLSRGEDFYQNMGVPDSFDGRFEMQVLLVNVLMRRLRKAGSDFSERVSQAMFDEMFATMDLALREQGVGDLSVAKQMKRMIGGFYGRGEIYNKALDASDRSLMVEALVRNVYGTLRDENDSMLCENASKLAVYVEQFEMKLLALSDEDLLMDKNVFLDVVVSEAA